MKIIIIILKYIYKILDLKKMFNRVFLSYAFLLIFLASSTF